MFDVEWYYPVKSTICPDTDFLSIMWFIYHPSPRVACKEIISNFTESVICVDTNSGKFRPSKMNTLHGFKCKILKIVRFTIFKVIYWIKRPNHKIFRI